MALDQQRQKSVKVREFCSSEGDPMDWIQMFEVTCEGRRVTNDVDRISAMLGNLDLNSLKWAVAERSASPFLSWNEWKASFILAFGESLDENFRRALYFRYRPPLTIGAYFIEVSLLRRYVSRVTDEAIMLFVKQGFPPKSRDALNARMPVNYDEIRRFIYELIPETFVPGAPTAPHSSSIKRNNSLSTDPKFKRPSPQSSTRPPSQPRYTSTVSSTSS
jgi:hypothetical protein